MLDFPGLNYTKKIVVYGFAFRMYIPAFTIKNIQLTKKTQKSINILLTSEQ